MGLARLGSAVCVHFTGFGFCVYFVCVCVEVVNGSGKRVIGLLGGNEGAQLLTLRSAGGEQRLNRTEIHLSI